MSSASMHQCINTCSIVQFTKQFHPIPTSTIIIVVTQTSAATSTCVITFIIDLFHLVITIYMMNQRQPQAPLSTPKSDFTPVIKMTSMMTMIMMVTIVSTKVHTTDKAFSQGGFIEDIYNKIFLQCHSSSKNHHNDIEKRNHAKERKRRGGHFA